MGKHKRSLIGHLTLTVWESWTAETHWRNAVIIALIGSIAFFMALPGNSVPNTKSSQSIPQVPQAMTNNGVILTPILKKPIQLKPKISVDEVILQKAKENQSTFGRSHGE